MKVKKEEMPPCVGPEGQGCNRPVPEVVIQGYDDKHRCLPCHKVHIALVEKEAGESAPGSTPKFVSASLHTKAEQERRKAILRELSSNRR